MRNTFEVSFKNKKAIPSFEVDVDSKMIDDQIKNMQNQYGKLVSKNTIEDGLEITGTFTNEELEVNNPSTFQLKNINSNLNKKHGRF